MSCLSITNATTACSGFVSVAINPGGTLQAKTALVVLTGAPGQETMAVYRESGQVPGALSLDRYTLDGPAWGSPRKDPQKYVSAPHHQAPAASSSMAWNSGLCNL